MSFGVKGLLKGVFSKKGNAMILVWVTEALAVLFIIFIFFRVAQAVGTSEDVVKTAMAEEIRLVVNTLIGMDVDAKVVFPYDPNLVSFTADSLNEADNEIDVGTDGSLSDSSELVSFPEVGPNIVVTDSVNLSQFTFRLESNEIMVYKEGDVGLLVARRAFSLPEGYAATGTVSGVSSFCIEKQSQEILLTRC